MKVEVVYVGAGVGSYKESGPGTWDYPIKVQDAFIYETDTR